MYNIHDTEPSVSSPIAFVFRLTSETRRNIELRCATLCIPSYNHLSMCTSQKISRMSFPGYIYYLHCFLVILSTLMNK